MSIRVLVFCVTYNHKDYIRQTLDGFIMQKTNFEFEVIVHDDCSTDGTTEIIKEYESKYPNLIKPIYQSENQYSKGLEVFSKALYPLYFQTKGDYIALCEGDDWWTDPNKLQKQVDLLDAEPDVNFCFTETMYKNEMDTPIFKTKKDPDWKYFPVTKTVYKIKDYYTIKDFLECGWFTATCSVAFRKSCLPNPAPDFFHNSPNGDMCLYYVLLRNGGKFKIINEPMTEYHKHEGGISVKNKLDSNRANFIRLYEDLNEFYNYEENEFFTALINRERYHWINEIYPEFVARKNHLEVLFGEYVNDKLYFWDYIFSIKQDFRNIVVRFLGIKLTFKRRKKIEITYQAEGL